MSNDDEFAVFPDVHSSGRKPSAEDYLKSIWFRWKENSLIFLIDFVNNESYSHVKREENQGERNTEK